MDNSLPALLLLGVLALPDTWAGSHSMRVFYTVVSRPNLGEPRFLAEGYVDDQQIEYFDSDAPSPRVEPRAAWMEQMVQVDPDYWEWSTRGVKANARILRVSLETLQYYYNQSERGVHTFQKLLGCEVSPGGRFQSGFSQYAYNGQDYITLDTGTWTWAALAPQAVATKHKWEMEKSMTEGVRADLKETCVLWVHKYLEIGKEALTRTDPPSARVTCHTAPNAEVTLRCRVQDFYPAEISLTWLRDGEEQLQDMEFIETRPGGDGTFQKWAAVAVTPGQEWRYSCRVQHKGLAEPLTLKWKSSSSSTWIIVGVIAGVLLPTAVFAGAVIWRKKNSESSSSSIVGVIAGILLLFLLTAAVMGVVIWSKKNSGGNGGNYVQASDNDCGLDVSPET